MKTKEEYRKCSANDEEAERQEENNEEEIVKSGDELEDHDHDS